MEELLLVIWAWLALAIFATLVSVVLKVIVQLFAQVLVNSHQLASDDAGIVNRFISVKVGVWKILSLSLAISGVVCFLFWAFMR